MQRTVRLALNQVPQVPSALRRNHEINLAADTTSLEIERLCHMLYLDNYGQASGAATAPYFALFSGLLTATTDLRFRGDGPGIVADARREDDRRLGQAVCRLMLHDHFRIRYFAHVSAILDETLSQGRAGLRLLRAAAGDTPDYLCAESTTRVRLAEAKGHKPSVSFTTQKFQEWRDQFARVRLIDNNGIGVATKGYIVATRIANERTPTIDATVSIEDPKSPGIDRGDDDNAPNAALAVIAGHYSRVSEALGQPVLGYLLRRGGVIQGQGQFTAGIFRCLVPPFGKRRFVGVHVDEDWWPGPDRYWLRHRSSGTFFGVEESVFKTMCTAARDGRQALAAIQPMETDGPSTAPLAAFEDGTVSGPEAFFDRVGIGEY